MEECFLSNIYWENSLNKLMVQLSYENITERNPFIQVQKSNES